MTAGHSKAYAAVVAAYMQSVEKAVSECAAWGEHAHMANVERLRRCPICDRRFRWLLFRTRTTKSGDT